MSIDGATSYFANETSQFLDEKFVGQVNSRNDHVNWLATTHFLAKSYCYWCSW